MVPVMVRKLLGCVKCKVEMGEGRSWISPSVVPTNEAICR